MITAERKMKQGEFDSIQVGDIVTYRLDNKTTEGKVIHRRVDGIGVVVAGSPSTLNWVYQDELVVQYDKVDEVSQPEFKPMIAGVYAHDTAIPSIELKITAQKGFDILVSLLDNPSVCHITLKRDKE
jgi:hypothetical protein